MKTLFLVDDDELIINSFRRVFTLKREEYGPRFFTDPLKALEALEDGKPDFLFTDISMRGMDGWELLEQFRKRSPGTKLIVISGDVDRTAGEGKADHFLEKPCPFSALTAIMERGESGDETG